MAYFGFFCLPLIRYETAMFVATNATKTRGCFLQLLDMPAVTQEI